MNIHTSYIYHDSGWMQNSPIYSCFLFIRFHKCIDPYQMMDKSDPQETHLVIFLYKKGVSKKVS